MHDLLVVLNRRAAGAPVGDATITSGGALDTVLLADSAALLHDPSAIASVSRVVSERLGREREGKGREKGRAYIQPQPTAQLSTSEIRQSLLNVSAVFIEGSRMRSAVLPWTVLVSTHPYIIKRPHRLHHDQLQDRP